MRFTALQTFWSDVMQSQYVRGMSYAIRPGNEKLAAQFANWTKDGLAAPGELDEATISAVAPVLSPDEIAARLAAHADRYQAGEG